MIFARNELIDAFCGKKIRPVLEVAVIEAGGVARVQVMHFQGQRHIRHRFDPVIVAHVSAPSLDGNTCTCRE